MWRDIAPHLLPTSKQKTIQERIADCNVERVQISAAKRVKELIGMYNELAIIDVSAVAVPFHRWVSISHRV